MDQAQAMQQLAALDPSLLAHLASLGKSLGMTPGSPLGNPAVPSPSSPPEKVPMKLGVAVFAEPIDCQEDADRLATRINKYLDKFQGMVEMWREKHEGVLIIGINTAVPRVPGDGDVSEEKSE